MASRGGLLRVTRAAHSRRGAPDAPSAGVLHATRVEPAQVSSDVVGNTNPIPYARAAQKKKSDSPNGTEMSLWESMGLHRKDIRRFYLMWLWGGVVMSIVYFQFVKATEVVSSLRTHSAELKAAAAHDDPAAELEAQRKKEEWMAEMRARQAAKAAAVKWQG